VLKTLHRYDVTHFSLEDVFVDGDASTDRLAWINGWRHLPHIDREVQRLYEYPQQFAEDVFDRIEREPHRCVCDGEASEVVQTGRLILRSEDDRQTDSQASPIPDLAARYIASSDREMVAEHKAEDFDQEQLLRDRQEGHYIVSFETSGGWVAIKKDMLTEVLGAGRDVKIVGLPLEAAQVLRLMCLGMASDQASMPPSMLKA
jgi:hypothetical protein